MLAQEACLWTWLPVPAVWQHRLWLSVYMEGWYLFKWLKRFVSLSRLHLHKLPAYFTADIAVYPALEIRTIFKSPVVLCDLFYAISLCCVGIWLFAGAQFHVSNIVWVFFFPLGFGLHISATWTCCSLYVVVKMRVDPIAKQRHLLQITNKFIVIKIALSQGREREWEPLPLHPIVPLVICGMEGAHVGYSFLNKAMSVSWFPTWSMAFRAQSLWFSSLNLYLRVAQLPPSLSLNCLIWLDTGLLIMTAAVVLESEGNYPLIAFLHTRICCFDVALALQTITKKWYV